MTKITVGKVCQVCHYLCARCFLFIISLNPHSMKEVLFIPISQKGKLRLRD